MKISWRHKWQTYMCKSTFSYVRDFWQWWCQITFEEEFVLKTLLMWKNFINTPYGSRWLLPGLWERLIFWMMLFRTTVLNVLVSLASMLIQNNNSKMCKISPFFFFFSAHKQAGLPPPVFPQIVLERISMFSNIFFSKKRC